MARTKSKPQKSLVKKIQKKRQSKSQNKDENKNLLKRKYVKPGVAALREIKKYQKQTDLLIRKMPFQRLVRRISKQFMPESRFSEQALRAIQQFTETYVVGLFEDSVLCMLHGKRVTLFQKDLLLARRIRGDNNRFPYI